MCSVCSAGTFSVEASSVCSNCPIGQFQNDIGQSTCNACQGGTFQAQIGSSTCTPCPFDFTAKEKQTFWFKDCRSCFNATSTGDSEISCCNSTRQDSIILNVSSIRGEFSSPGILMINEIENLINSALASQKNIFNLVKFVQDDEALSIGNASGKPIKMYVLYGGFQLRLDQYSSEFLGFRDPVPPTGPTQCRNRTLKPSLQDGCMPCDSDYSLIAPEVGLTLKSRYN